MTEDPDGRKPDRQNWRIGNYSESDPDPYEHTPQFGSPDDPRRAFWSVLVEEFEDSREGADWQDVLDAAEADGIDRGWAHRELIRRLRWGDVHLHRGNIYPHYRRR